ncbi:MAG: DUF2807 domain-containing protein [Gammaproteobacteria bacterium]|nr:DUF2807 domain-containing protein [Gammaproteobacteria bacterium]NNJ72826.1 hypothetical protein [Enterobacterales bacterium]
MHNKLIRGCLVGGCLVFTATIFSAEQLLEVDDFTGLSLGTGIVGTVSCGNTNTVTLIGNKEALENLHVTVVNSELAIERKSRGLLNSLMGNDNNTAVEANVVTRGQIATIDASTGSVLSVDGCAVNNSVLEIDASTGSTLNVSGETVNLTLDMSTGSQFNTKTSDFSAEVVELDMSTGSTANLCKSKVISGSASTGAVIYAGQDTNVSDVSLSLGADTSSRRCQ